MERVALTSEKLRGRGVCLVDEVHVETRGLLGSGGQVVEVRVVGHSARPVSVDLGHVHPGHEGAGKGIEESFLGIIDLGHSQDVVNVGDEGYTFVGHQEGRGVAAQSTVGVDIESLHILVGYVTRKQAILLDGQEDVKIALGCSLVWQLDVLSAAGCLDRVAAASLAVAALHGRGLQVHGDILLALLDNVD
jgi:hypothetical protein